MAYKEQKFLTVLEAECSESTRSECQYGWILGEGPLPGCKVLIAHSTFTWREPARELPGVSLTRTLIPLTRAPLS